jgi:hypothetical protein
MTPHSNLFFIVAGCGLTTANLWLVLLVCAGSQNPVVIDDYRVLLE